MNKTLTRDEEQRLFLCSKSCPRARERFIEANTGLVWKACWKYQTRTVPAEDLFSAGVEGLIRAVDLFDPSRGLKFSTFAVWHIRRAVLRAQYEMYHVVRKPVYFEEMLLRYRGLMSECEKYQTSLSDEEIIERLHKEGRECTPEHLEYLRLWDTPVSSLQARINERKNEYWEILAVEDPNLKALEVSEEWQLIQNALQQITPQERTILRMRIVDKMKLEDIGITLGVSKQRVTQIVGKILRQLRHECGKQIPIEEGLFKGAEA